MNFKPILFVCFAVVLSAELGMARRTRDRERPWRSQTTPSPDGCPPRRRPCTKDCGTAGFMRTESGCELCACNTRADCPALECPSSDGVCPYGHAQDENHCPLCECRPSWRCSSAPRPSCSMHCELGFVVGPDGCPTCTCYQPPTASQLPAPAADVVAASTGSDQVQQLPGPARTRPAPRRPEGAAAGRSATPPTPTCPICMRYCPAGFKMGADGCPLCECHDDPWALLHHSAGRGASVTPSASAPRVCATCMRFCPTGFKMGADGCPLCECNDDPPAIGHHSAGASVAPPVCATCMRFCPTGFKMGDNGCPLCQCNDEEPTGTGAPDRQRGGGRRGGRPARRRNQLSCLRPTCAMFCENGFRRDSNGCTLCECQQPGDPAIPLPTNPSVQCSPLRCHRAMKCAFGFAIDSSTNCPTCACRTSAGAD